MYNANLGDSRCIMKIGDEVLAVSIDHTLELEEEKDRILKAGGTVSGGMINKCLTLTRAIGDLHLKADKSKKFDE